MKTQAKILLFSLFLLTCSPTFADWDPDFIEGVGCSSLEDKNYQTLKKKVTEALEGSWCSKEKVDLLMDLVLLIKPQVCVEIGVCTGSSLLPIATTLQYLKSGKVYAIDAWSNQIATRHLEENDPNKDWWSRVDMKSIQNTFNNLIASWNLKNLCEIIEKPSALAVFQIPEIDFLHLDGDYSEKGSTEDVTFYLPKVKSGGYILLSNLFIMINGKQPKLKSFSALLEECEIVCEIERDNGILFRKY